MENLKHKTAYSFRSSKLTFLLEEYLKGGAKTIVIGNMSPSANHMRDAKSTLEFLQNTVAKVVVGVPEATKFINGERVITKSMHELENI